jgi:cell division protein FtsI (penicillin-binding protein 3)
VDAIRDNGRLIESFDPEVIDSAICSAATIAKAREMLEEVVKSGTGSKLRHSQYQIAGKTGTARVANNNEGYSDPKYQASFVGYFPADRPKYSCMVVVYAPSNDVYYASEVAAPIFKDISDKVYATRFDLQRPVPDTTDLPRARPLAKAGSAPYTRLAYAGLSMDAGFLDGREDWVRIIEEGDALRARPLPRENGKVPDTRGMGLRDAICLLENAGLQVTVKGRGRVTRQTPAPGTAYQRGQGVVIELN